MSLGLLDPVTVGLLVLVVISVAAERGVIRYESMRNKVVGQS
jgi:hypothetical protein